jgi:hypothetical protein
MIETSNNAADRRDKTGPRDGVPGRFMPGILPDDIMVNLYLESSFSETHPKTICVDYVSDTATRFSGQSR